MEGKADGRNRRHDPNRSPQPDRRGKAWDDPEFAWKQREKELLAWYGVKSEESGEGWDGQESRNWSFVPSKKQVWLRLLASLAAFGAVWGLFQSNAPWAEKGKRFVSDALSQEMDLQAAAAWYRRTFSGAPSFIPAFGSHKKEEAAKVSTQAGRTFTQPVRGTVVSPYSERLQGIVLETETAASVRAMDSGRVVFAGSREGTGHTVIIQHPEGYRTTYGYLQPTEWEVSDWLNAGDVVGTVSPAPERGKKGRLFLSVMKEQRYVNPVDVVSFD